jgi:hypothetical protein
MKTRLKIFLSIAIAVGLLANAAVVQVQASQKLAEFHINVALNADRNGIDMKCDVGCRWTSLSFTCADTGKCSSWIDVGGMTGED